MDSRIVSFVTRYADIVSTVWADARALRRLRDDPIRVLGSFGILSPNVSSVKIVEVQATCTDEVLSQAIALWQQGCETGRYEFLLPTRSELETRPIDDLDMVVGGSGVAWTRWGALSEL